MAINDGTLGAHKRARVALDKYVDGATADLAKAWATAWDELADEFTASINDLIVGNDGTWPSRTKIMRAQRAKNALDAAAASINSLSTDAGARITKDLKELVAAAAQWEGTIALTQLPTGHGVLWTRVADRALDAIVKRSTQQIHSDLKPLSKAAESAMKRGLVRGVATGRHPTEVARTVLRNVQGGFNGGLTRARVIARTEMLDAHRAGALTSRKANSDVLAGWTWITALDQRTCPACLSQHGSVHGVDEPGPEGHQCCRCTGAPTTRSWRDLGFDIDEPESILPDAQAWFDAQAADIQKDIMGPGRLDLYQSGKLDWNDLSMVKHTDGWRDSIVTRPLALIG